MGAWMRCSRWLGGWATALLLAVAPVAQASPVFGLANASGFVGQQVSFRLSGNVDLFNGAQLTISFSPTDLAFAGVAPGAFIFASTPAALGLELVIISETPGEPLLLAGSDFSYFDLLFTILGTAASGPTFVDVQSGAVLQFANPDPLKDEVDVVLSSPLRATVTVLVNNEVPLPGTASLALAALGLLALSRRSRKALAPAVPA